jgi:hypothetical protein
VEGEADILITLSSDKIAEVMEVHFNEVLLKQKVRIVDLHSTSSGYAFALEFIPDVLPLPDKVDKLSIDVSSVAGVKEGDLVKISVNNGSFVEKDDVNSCVSSDPKEKKGTSLRRKNGRFISDISSTR